MKKQKRSILIASIMLIVYGCGNGGNRQEAEVNSPQKLEQKKQAPDSTDVSFKDGITGRVFHNYLQLKKALTASDSKGASAAATNLTESLNEKHPELKEAAEKIGKTSDLEEQRRLFSAFTQLVTPLIEENLQSGSIYQKFCPMAFDNTGAYWLSDIEPVNNPYFGKKMLHCGRIERTFEK